MDATEGSHQSSFLRWRQNHLASSSSSISLGRQCPENNGAFHMKDDPPAGSASDPREELPQDPVAIANPERCRGDFTYSMTPTKLIVRDTGKGERSVLEDLPAVLKKIECWHQGSLEHFGLVVLDADGRRVR
jgi:hypothetical protein